MERKECYYSEQEEFVKNQKNFKVVKEQSTNRSGLNLEKLFKELEATFSNYRDERKVEEYVSRGGTNFNTFVMKAGVQDVFEFCLYVLNQNKKGGDVIGISKDKYQISATSMDKDYGELALTMNLFQKGEELTIIEFRNQGTDKIQFKKMQKEYKAQFKKQLKKFTEAGEKDKKEEE